MRSLENLLTTVAAAAALSACGADDHRDAIGPDPTPIPVVDSDAAGRADTFHPLYLATVAIPTSKGCAAESLRGVADDLQGPGLVLQEAFGADGCLDERFTWVRDTEERPLEEDYEYFDPNLGRFTYALPESYTRLFSYDGDVVTSEVYIPQGRDEPTNEVTRELDAAGRVVRETRRDRSGPDGAVRLDETVWQFDASGREILQERWFDGARHRATATTYDDRGRVVEVRVDRGSGWVVTRQLTYDGDRVAWEASYRDLDARLVSEATYTYAADGSSTKTEQDHEHGWVNVWTFDRRGQELSYTQDSEPGGAVEYMRLQEYDDDGNRTRVWTGYDFDANGAAQRTSENLATYDDQGRLVEELSQEAWRDALWLTRHQYGRTRDVTTVEQLETSNTPRFVRYRTVKDKAGNDRIVQRDDDGDGLFSTTLYRFDGPRQVEQLVDVDGDLLADSVQQWIYDEAGRLVRHLGDVDADGAADSRVDYYFGD